MPPGVSGALTRLLEELAHAPEGDFSGTWKHPLRPGEVVGRFELLREIGRGGFGVVYEARDLQLNRTVAFKALRPGRALSAQHADALRREAEAAAQLNHPNVVTLHDFGTCPSGPYLILERLRGETLADRLERGRLLPLEAVRVASDVARALVHAHAAGVLHRDLKPANVFLGDDGAVKVLDFGLARLLGVGGAKGGTPSYMAPEQWRGEQEDERTDLFALGVMLHVMLTGALPFAVERGRSAALDPGPSPQPEVPGVPRALPRLVQRLLAKEPAARPAHAAAVLEELLAVRRQLEAVAGNRTRRRIVVASLALAGLALVGRLALRTLAPGERVVVAVADVANQTGEPDLDGLSGLLITSLEQSRRLSVLTRSRMFDLARQGGHPGAARLDESVARDIGRRAGARALLFASIHRFDGVYALELKALDPAADEYLFTVKAQGQGKASIPRLIDRLSADTRKQLKERGEDVQASEVKVAQAVTGNLEAYRHYFDGVDCLDRPSQGASWTSVAHCAEHFRRALAVDPDFVLAHYQLAVLGATERSGDVDPRAAIGEAMRGLARVPAKEQRLIRAWRAHLDGRDEEALALYDESLQEFPDDKHSLYLAGDLLHHGGDLARAIPYFERALALDPGFEWVLDHVVQDLGALGRREALSAHLAAWAKLPPTPALTHALVRGHVWLGDPGAALAAARRGAALGGPAAAEDLARVEVLRGDLAAAEATLAAIASPTEGATAMRASVIGSQGRVAEGLHLLEGLRPDMPAAAFHYTRALYLLGDSDLSAAVEEARATAQLDAPFAATLATLLTLRGAPEVAAQLAVALAPGSSAARLYDALRAWRAGDAAAAKVALRAVDARDPLPDLSPSPAYLLAEVCAAERDDACTLEALQRFRVLWPMGVWRAWAYPRSQYLAAVAHARRGEDALARGELDRLLAWWSRADPQQPLLQEARDLRLRLR